jgi:hypothetical protein
LQKTAGFEDISKIIPQLSEKVIEYIKDTPMFFKRMAQSAQVFKGLDYNTKIYNLSIPISYGSAIKSVNIKELQSYFILYLLVTLMIRVRRKVKKFIEESRENIFKLL